VVAAVAAEAVVRSAIDGRITAAAHKRLTGPVSVGIGATPALFDAVTGQIPTVTIQAPSTSMCILRDVSATASLTGVHRAQDGTAVQGTSADVTLVSWNARAAPGRRAICRACLTRSSVTNAGSPKSALTVRRAL
jgi:LmeA-like phospholipid-binding